MTNSILRKKIFDVVKTALTDSISAWGDPVKYFHDYVSLAFERMNKNKPLISFPTKEDRENFPWIGTGIYPNDSFLVLGRLDLGTGFVYGHIGATKAEIMELEELFVDLNSDPKFFFQAICEAFLEYLKGENDD